MKYANKIVTNDVLIWNLFYVLILIDINNKKNPKKQKQNKTKKNNECIVLNYKDIFPEQDIFFYGKMFAVKW